MLVKEWGKGDYVWIRSRLMIGNKNRKMRLRTMLKVLKAIAPWLSIGPFYGTNCQVSLGREGGLCGAGAIRPRLGKIQSVLWKALYQFRFTGQYSNVLLEELAKTCSTVIHDILYHNLCELDWQSCQLLGYLSKIIKLIQIRLNCNYLFLQTLLRYWCACISVAYLIAI